MTKLTDINAMYSMAVYYFLFITLLVSIFYQYGLNNVLLSLVLLVIGVAISAVITKINISVIDSQESNNEVPKSTITGSTFITLIVSGIYLFVIWVSRVDKNNTKIEKFVDYNYFMLLCLIYVISFIMGVVSLASHN